METKQLKIAEQEDILNETGKSLIVSASAGSGKTTVMIRKILKYILDRSCHVNELLVLTYTKSAAEEMKKKLLDKLKDNLKKYEFLQEELDLIQNADISTFDSFCQKLVKKYFYILNIDPSFGILEGGEQKYFQAEALNRALDEIKANSPEVFENLIDNLSSKRDEENIKQIILEIYSYMTSILNEQEFIDNSLNLYNFEEKPAEKFLKQYYNSIFYSFRLQLEDLRQKSISLEFSQYTKYIGNFILILQQLISEQNFGKFVDYLYVLEFGILRAEKNDEVGLKEEILNIKKAFVKCVDDIKKNLISSKNIEKSYINCQILLKNIFILLNLFKEKYLEQKTKINMFDFDDIERFAITLLQNEQIRTEIKNSYKYIFVDEFQDANHVQEKLIFLLGNNNLFFVGDTKQSIYAFRQSDPEIFLNIENGFKNSTNASAKTLNCNFRTNKNILQFVNEIFNIIMTEQTCKLNYKQKAQFEPKADYLDLKNEVCVDLNIISQETEVPDKLEIKNVYSVKENLPSQAEQNQDDKESLFVCNKILQVLGQEIYDKETGKIRKIDYNDITILLLKRGGFLQNLIKHFNLLGIPYVVNVNNNLEDTYDNLVLYNLLKLTLNRQDDYAMFSVLSSALFNFSDTELAEIRQSYQSEKYFYECLNLYAQSNKILCSKVNNFYEVLNEFTFNVKYFGIYFALENIIKKTNYLLNISTDEDYAERKLNIQNYINSFVDSKYNNDIYNYITYRETALRKEKVETNKTFSKCVEITTMHSSKGLEYPVVILPFLGVDFTKEPSHIEIKINKELGVGIKSYDTEDRTASSGIFYCACKLKNKEIELSEKIRLLYVAMTRAKNKLILCGTMAKNFIKFKNDYQVITTNNYLSLICGALPDNIVQELNKNNEIKQHLYNNNKLVISKQNVVIDNFEEQKDIFAKQNDDININKLSHFLKMDLSNQKSEIALKNSVSEFAFDNDASLNFAPQNFTLAEHLSEKASDIGTLYHLLLQQIDFNEINSVGDVKDYIECNFSEQDIAIFNNITYENIFKNILLIKSYIDFQDTILKEQKFVMYVPYKEVAGGNKEDKILVQGIIDLVIIKKDTILLFDYKLSKKSNEQIKQKYEKQIELYKLALSKRFKNFNIKSQILNLSQNYIINYD